MLAFRLLFASFILAVPALAAPSGKLGFVSAKGAQILNLQTGKVRSLPQSANATALSISPWGTAIYFVPAVGTKPRDDGSGTPANGRQSLPPYSSAKLQPSLQNLMPFAMNWNSNGTTLYISTDTVNGAFTPAMGRFTTLKTLPASFDARGRKMAYSTENQIIVRDVASRRDHVMFDIRKPEPMFAALRAAKYPKNVKDLLPDETGFLAKDVHNWQLSDPALAPDGSRLYFTSNVGTGYGAAGNGEFALFAVDLKTNKLAVLSKVGELFGRPPHIFRVSPNGKRLMLASSVHNNAADNSCFVEIVDLLTQNSREVFLGVLPATKDKANFLDSAVWSPDSKYVATSGYFYDTNKAMPDDNGDWPEVKSSQYTAAIVDAATGKSVKTIKGATSLNWMR
ncbi:hypothetical protein IAD21_02650 [Abditibacteriota bacterium]|nr:hypothetical protein IAD21_02650 [Abditibacteriota bacterium]